MTARRTDENSRGKCCASVRCASKNLADSTTVRSGDAEMILMLYAAETDRRTTLKTFVVRAFAQAAQMSAVALRHHRLLRLYDLSLLKISCVFPQ